MALLCAVALTAAPVLGTAEAKKKKKPKGTYGKFVGFTEYDGTVTYTLTRARKIVGFTLTNATLYCHTDVPNENPTYFPEYTKTVTITHGPIPMQMVSKKNPQGKKFSFSDPDREDVASSGGLFEGRIESLTSTPSGGRVTGTGMAGEVSYGTTNGPFGAPGTEWCVTKTIDWEAKRPGDKGFVFAGGSGHGRPPLSVF